MSEVAIQKSLTAEIKSLTAEIKEYIAMLNDPEDKDRKVAMARESLERIGVARFDPIIKKK